MSVGDVTSSEPGSGARYNSGKYDISLIPLCTLEDEARVWMFGAAKYTAWNWAKGMNWSVPLASALRHLAAFQRGEDSDPESGLPHIAHAMCNLRMLTLYSRTFRKGDDRARQWLGDAALDPDSPEDESSEEEVRGLLNEASSGIRGAMLNPEQQET